MICGRTQSSRNEDAAYCFCSHNLACTRQNPGIRDEVAKVLIIHIYICTAADSNYSVMRSWRTFWVHISMHVLRQNPCIRTEIAEYSASTYPCMYWTRNQVLELRLLVALRPHIQACTAAGPNISHEVAAEPLFTYPFFCCGRTQEL